MLANTFIVLVAAASMASAQNCSASLLKATSQADLDQIASCSNYTGSIQIETVAGVLTLNGVQNIGGSLTIKNSSDLSSFSAPSLKQIDGDLDLQVLTSLSTLSMPQLTDVAGITFVTLPMLEELQFNAGVQNCKNIHISDTLLKSLQGLNLSDVDNFQVNNNRNIDSISVAATEISQSLDISFNAPQVNVSLPNLQWVNNATFRYCSSVDMPEITKVNSTLAFVNNTLYTLQFDKLQSVGNLAINSNSELRNASFANLTAINGGLQVANNSHFNTIHGFPKLKTIRGAVLLEGNLTQALFPSLDQVDGGVQINSTGAFNCSNFDAAHSKGQFHGDKYVCKGISTSVSASLSAASGSSSGAGSSGSASRTGSASGSSDSSATATSSSGSTKSGSSGSSNSNMAAPLVAGSGVFGAALAVAVALL